MSVLGVSRLVMWFIVTFGGRWCSRLNNPQTQQSETCPTLATALDQLERIDAAFDGSPTIGQAQWRFTCGLVSLHPLCQALQFSQIAGLRRSQPRPELLWLALAQHCAKLDCQSLQLREGRVCLLHAH
jgi:hypothetical protein